MSLLSQGLELAVARSTEGGVYTPATFDLSCQLLQKLVSPVGAQPFLLMRPLFPFHPEIPASTYEARLEVQLSHSRTTFFLTNRV